MPNCWPGMAIRRMPRRCATRRRRSGGKDWPYPSLLRFARNDDEELRLGQIEQGARVEADAANLLRDGGPDVGQEILTHQVAQPLGRARRDEHADPALHRDQPLVLKGLIGLGDGQRVSSEEHTSELQSLMRISYAVFC